jgi:hypothetical protein
MKVTLKGKFCLSASMALAMAVSFLSPTNASAQVQNAQSAMVDVTFDSSAYQIDGTTTWTYDRDLAETYYLNAWNGSAPVRGCSGGGANGCVTPPATPSAPAPLPNPLTQHAQQERCTFFSAGTLISNSYTQSVVINVNGSGIPAAQKGNWTYVFTYAVTPLTPGTVAAYTAWTSEVETTTVDVAFTGFVASESFQKQGSRSKYSFTMVDSGVSRARNVVATLQKADGLGGWIDIAIADLNNVDTDADLVNDALAIAPALTNFTYFGNGGIFGNSAVFAALHATGNKLANAVDNIVKGISDGSSFVDNFAGNDNDLASGNVHGGPFASTFLGLSDSGDYRVRVSGALKGNSGLADLGFSVGSSSVVIGGCTLPTP